MKCCIRMFLVPLLLIACWSLVASLPRGDFTTTQNGQTVKKNYERLARRLDAVAGSLDFDTVARIGADINDLPLAPKEDAEWRNWRRAKLELWLRALDLIDRTKDPSFNPEDVPQINVAPPRATGLPAGVSPRHIEDPKLRQEYEQAINRNSEKAKRYLLQYQIPNLDRQWTESLKVYLTAQYTKEVRDVDEIRTLIDRHISNDSRKQQIRSFFMQREGTKP